MAIEALQKSAGTYQGSVSGTDMPKNQENITVATAERESPVESVKNGVLPIWHPETVKSDSRLEETQGNKTDAARQMGLDAVSLQEKQNERIKKTIEEINKNSKNSEAIFGIHDATNRVTIKIVDKSSKKVLKEYPPEQTLDMIAKVWELAGLMVDEKR